MLKVYVHRSLLDEVRVRACSSSPHSLHSVPNYHVASLLAKMRPHAFPEPRLRIQGPITELNLLMQRVS